LSGGVSVVVTGTAPLEGVLHRPGAVEATRWAELAREVLVAEGIGGPSELTLGFVSESEMAELNHQWMGEDGPTDVLSWPIDAGGDPSPLPGVPLLLGDVMICPAVARRYATAAGRPIDDELALLVVHGVLHVLGHDHATAAEEAAMQAREAAHLTHFHDPRWTRTSS
jgi:probable rRNA maturation factor